MTDVYGGSLAGRTCITVWF